MIDRYFQFLPGIGARAEKKLNAAGICDWQSFLESDVSFISNSSQCIDSIKESMAALKNRDSQYFARKIPVREHWRLYPHFSSETCFLDIETTGLSKDRDYVTTVSFYNGSKVHTLIQGFNLSGESLRKEFSRYRQIVTFNGICFDIPFLESKYPGLSIGVPHIDLRWVGRKAGYSGGLKRIEKTLGISRDEDLAGIDGLEAVRLWLRWKYKHSKEDLASLIRYNQEDVINLKQIMEIMYAKLTEQVSSDFQ